VSFNRLPPTTLVPNAPTGSFRKTAARTIAQGGRWVQQVRLKGREEVFGSPTVEVSANATGGWARLVVVLSARTPAGKDIVVSAGGVPTTAGARRYRVTLLSQATYVPAGSTWKVTVSSSTLAQSPGNLMYLDLPMPASARLTVSGVTFSWPTLRTPIST
jgi:predicted acyl esterase